ncbi:MAG: PP2C family protein-serine/threonine phosphatase, partial [Planctomycetota bacterium]
TTKEIVTELNKHLIRDTMPGMFLTFLLLRWVPHPRRLLFCGAGHEHVLVLTPKKREVKAIMAGGMSLGISPKGGETYSEKAVPFEPGSVVLLYSDGVTEAMDPGLREFGLDRLKAALKKHGEKPVKDLVDSVLREVGHFTGTAPQGDDITLVAMRRKEDG